MIPAALAPLTHYRQFIVCKLVPKADKPGKVDKIPVDPVTGANADAHNPANQYDAGTAVALLQAMRLSPLPAGVAGYCLGFVFTEGDPFWFLDIDGCIDGDQWSPLAVELLTALSGCAVEVSQSGRGVHVFGCGQVPAHACKDTKRGLEFYTSGRFVALTCNTIGTGNAAFDATATIGQIVAQYFPPREGGDIERGEGWTTQPVPEWNGPEDDTELIARALNTTSGAAILQGKATFSDLFFANVEALARAYPDNYGARPYDSSSADAALAQHLAFWTGKNCERIARIMWQSRLLRPKWTEHKTYIRNTVTRACSLQGDRVYQARRAPEAPTTESEGPQFTQGAQFVSVTQQAEFFAGHVYVQDIHRVFLPNGALLKQEQFNARYGGYIFVLDSAGEKTTRKAWEAFTESQCIRWPKADGMVFTPERAPGAIVKRDGQTLVNVYVPIETKRQKGDPSRLLDHMARLLPDERDRMILLSYMAACVQHKGTKFQWAPLIQGAEGNGKTLLTRCVAFAIGRRYVHFPKAADIDNKFNGWLLNKLFIGVEDVFVPEHRREVIETLKPMITAGDGLEIQLKGQDQITADLCANFMLNSNHKDAIRKSENDRRFAIFYTAQQSRADIVRDGMSGNYFPDLYAWLRGEGHYAGKAHGYAIVNEFLNTFRIPDEFNPAGACHRAPETSSTGEVMKVSRGTVEQALQEAVEEGRPGFAGGWISSIALDRLLSSMRMGRAIPPNKRRELLQTLGYDWHPALPDGRVNNPTIIDNGKPRLFVHRDNAAALAIYDPAQVARAYTEAQMAAGGVPTFGRG